MLGYFTLETCYGEKPKRKRTSCPYSRSETGVKLHILRLEIRSFTAKKTKFHLLDVMRSGKLKVA